MRRLKEKPYPAIRTGKRSKGKNNRKRSKGVKTRKNIGKRTQTEKPNESASFPFDTPPNTPQRNDDRDNNINGDDDGFDYNSDCTNTPSNTLQHDNNQVDATDGNTNVINTDVG